jgi:hypothetical protein
MVMAAPPQQAQLPPIDFSKATLPKRSLMSTIAVPSTSLGGQSNFELDSKGYVAGLRLLAALTDTVAVANNTAQNIDYPWAIFNRIQIRDSVGNMIHNAKGYSEYLVGRYLQPYLGRDPATMSDVRGYSATLTGATAALAQTFGLDLPIETDQLNHIGLVPNQNAGFRYAVQLGWELSANLLTAGGGGTNTWTGLVQPSYRYYTVPAPVRGDGRQQMTMPPYAGIIRQIWDETQVCPTGGGAVAENRYPFVPGKVIRGFVIVTRGSTGIRTGTTATTGLQRLKIMYGDDTILFDSTVQDLIQEHYRNYGEVPPAGVYPINFMRDLAGIVGQTRNSDVLDTRELAQFYLLITTGSDVYSIDFVHDELIVPRGMTI